VVPPVEVLDQHVLELFDGAPRVVAVNEFSFDLPEGGLGEGVAATIDTSTRRHLRAGHKKGQTTAAATEGCSQS
jgi:hypothetical protein